MATRINSVTGKEQPVRFKQKSIKKTRVVEVPQDVLKKGINEDGEAYTFLEREMVEETQEYMESEKIQLSEAEESQRDQEEEGHRQHKMGPDLVMAIEAEADKRVAEVAPPEKISQMLARAARLNAEAGIKKRALTAEENAEVDQLIAVDNYTNAVRNEAERFIKDDLPLLTEDEKLNFNPATHPKLMWPVLT